MKLVYFLLIFLVMCSLVACNKKENSDNKGVKENKAEIQTLLDKDSPGKGELNDASSLNAEKNKQEENSKDEEETKLPVIKIDTDGVKFEWADEKGRLMTCRAKSFSGNQTDKILHLNNVNAILYENGKPSAEMFSEKATFDIDKKEIRAVSGVRLKSVINKSVFTCNKMLWKSKENKVFAEEGVLDTDYGKLTGRYFELDTKLEKFEIKDKGTKIF
ncbi:MAG: LPS export ABC transporter periplasmic protein LptC [Armatimonadetes bacterium]|nr:LPS export ABC transporter periplasmic protein LptC [Candidatus Hippobium faecium]